MTQLKKFSGVLLEEEEEDEGGVCMQKRRGQPTMGSRSYTQLESRSEFLMKPC